MTLQDIEGKLTDIFISDEDFFQMLLAYMGTRKFKFSKSKDGIEYADSEHVTKLLDELDRLHELLKNFRPKAYIMLKEHERGSCHGASKSCKSCCGGKCKNKK